jgi:hypothetical protein
MTDSQSASLSWCQVPIWSPRPDFYYCQTVAGLLMWGAISDERMGLSFTIGAGPHQRSHSWVQVPWYSWLYFTISDLRLPHPGGPGPPIYILQEQGGPVIPPGTGFPFCRLLWLTGLRWRYSNPLSRRVSSFTQKSESELIYDWWFITSQFVLAAVERMGLSLMNMPRFAFVKCTCRTYSMLLKILVHYIQVLCQSRLGKADHACLTYLMLQRQLSHLSSHKLDHHQV